MGIVAKETGGNIHIDPISQGVHLAVCYAIIDIGTQRNERFNKALRKVIIIWEIPDERIQYIKEDTKEAVDLPKVISKSYTLSLNEKSNLRKDLEHWRGKVFTPTQLEGFDLDNILGKTCQLQVMHLYKDNKVYVNVDAVMALPKGTRPLHPENEPYSWSVDEIFTTHFTDIPEKIPNWIQNLIKGSDDWKQKFFGNHPTGQRNNGYNGNGNGNGKQQNYQQNQNQQRNYQQQNQPNYSQQSQGSNQPYQNRSNGNGQQQYQQQNYQNQNQSNGQQNNQYSNQGQQQPYQNQGYNQPPDNDDFLNNIPDDDFDEVDPF